MASDDGKLERARRDAPHIVAHVQLHDDGLDRRDQVTPWAQRPKQSPRDYRDMVTDWGNTDAELGVPRDHFS